MLDDRYADLLDRSMRGEVLCGNETEELEFGTRRHFRRSVSARVTTSLICDRGVDSQDAVFAVGQATMRHPQGDFYELMAVALEQLRREELRHAA
jgi:hypothetical protein